MTGCLEKNKELHGFALVQACVVEELDTLTAPLLKELIDRIDVFEVEGTGKNRTQRIVINYKFVGSIVISEEAMEHYREETRKGVAIEYIPRPA